jgi:TRAP-type transport system periplasmic protein
MKFIPRRTALAAMGAVAALAVTGTAMAQTVTLRLHQMLPQQATIPAKAIVPWAQKVEAESGGKIKVQIFNAMQLGGAPPQLFDQAKDGVVDITWTVLGYTPGRFPKTEVFELPFMSSSAESSSKALQEYVEKFAADEFKDVKLIAVHTHGPGLFHTKQPVTGLETLRGMKVRGGSRIINNMLTKLGATPVGMPVPAVTDALSKGTIDGTTIPWEVTPSLKVTELVKNHTTFAGKEGLYTHCSARPWTTATRWAARSPSRPATRSPSWSWPRCSAGAAPPARWKPTGSTRSRPRASTAQSWRPKPAR